MNEVAAARCLTAGAAASLCCVAAPAFAGIWALAPTFSASAEYETNPLLRPVGAVPGTAIVANIGLPAQWDDGARHVEISPSVRLAEATGDSPIGANAYYLSGIVYVKSDRSEWSASLRLGDDSSALREPAAGTLLRTDVRERYIDTSPSWAHSFTERTQATLQAEWQSLDYTTPDAAQLGLFNYRYGTATAQLSHALTERTQLLVLAQASRYEVPTDGYNEDNYSVQAGLNGQATSLWAYKAMVGLSRLKDSTSGATTSGDLYLLSVNRTGLQSTWSTSLTKSIQPSGFGTLAQAIEADTTFQWRTSDRTSYSGSARWVETTNSFASFTLANRSYVSLSGAVTYRATEIWDVSGTLSWQRSATGATLFEIPASGQGYGIVITAQRRFGRVKLT
jgi:hypothetical protein